MFTVSVLVVHSQHGCLAVGLHQPARGVAEQPHAVDVGGKLVGLQADGLPQRVTGKTSGGTTA